MEQLFYSTFSLPLLQEAAATCETARDSTPYDVIANTQNISAYLSTFVPSSLNLPLYEEINSSMLDHVTCPGRHLHTTVYDPLSDSLWIFGGRESSGRLCDSGLAVVNLSLALAGFGNDSDEVGEEGEGLVRWVVTPGDAPSARQFHAAALLPVSEHTNSTVFYFFFPSFHYSTTEASLDYLVFYSVREVVMDHGCLCLEGLPPDWSLVGSFGSMTETVSNGHNWNQL